VPRPFRRRIDVLTAPQRLRDHVDREIAIGQIRLESVRVPLRRGGTPSARGSRSRTRSRSDRPDPPRELLDGLALGAVAPDDRRGGTDPRRDLWTKVDREIVHADGAHEGIAGAVEENVAVVRQLTGIPSAYPIGIVPIHVSRSALNRRP
jgi:hypothetical protein